MHRITSATERAKVGFSVHPLVRSRRTQRESVERERRRGEERRDRPRAWLRTRSVPLRRDNAIHRPCSVIYACMHALYVCIFRQPRTRFTASTGRFYLLYIYTYIYIAAAKNVIDGINGFDGTTHMYFHEGPEGYHDLWDSRIFNYGHWEVTSCLAVSLSLSLSSYLFMLSLSA